MTNIKTYIWFFLVALFYFPDGFGQHDYYRIKQISSRATDDVVTGFTRNGIIYSSNRPITSFLKYTDEEDRNTFNIWEISFEEDGSIGNASLFARELKTAQNDGPASLTEDGNLIVFTRNYSTRRLGNIRRSNPLYGLFFADFNNGVWTNIREFEHNLPDARTTHPSISPDGKTLYFSSDREGGYGGFDIYVSHYENGSWTVPENLGPQVNSGQNDIYPYIHPTGRLYFSSNGHGQTRVYDIYYSELYNNNWINPVRLPAPYNSTRNDFTIILDDAFEKGFVTSTRRGSMDIFMIELTLPAFDVCKQQKADNFCFVFYERSTMEIDTSLYRYVWDLGDGTKVEAVEAEHCFDGPGKYIISLDVVDVLTKEIMFNQAEYELELVKSVQPFITSPDTVLVQQDFQLHGFESYLGPVEPSEFYWEFGDGTHAVGASVKHTYMVPGKYNVKLGIPEEQETDGTIKKHCSYKGIVVLEQPD